MCVLGRLSLTKQLWQRSKRCEEYKSITVLALGKKWKFNTTVISASNNRSLFFRNQNWYRTLASQCGGSRLPAAQWRKPHDKANLKRKKCVCLLKASQGKRVGFSRGFFSPLHDESVIGEPPSGLNLFPEKLPNGKCKRSCLSILPLLMPHSSFSAPPANGHCELLEVDFPSVYDHSVSVSGQGAPTVKVASQ